MSDDSDDDPATLRERVRELEQTVREQQATIEQLMPSRRAVLAGGAGLVGGAALTGQASAQTAAGQVGTSSEPVDVAAASVAATDVTTDSISAGKINDGYIFASKEDGSDPDTRLASAISAAPSGGLVFLESDATYGDLTLDRNVSLIYPGNAREGPRIGDSTAATWEINEDINISGLDLNNAELVLNSVGINCENMTVRASQNITISQDRVLLNMIRGGGSVTFESGTTDGEMGVATGTVSVTDNGINSNL